MTSALIDRRRALAGFAAAPATIAIGRGAALANVDAELRLLWIEWLEAKAATWEAHRQHYVNGGHVARETKHLRCDWRFHDVALAAPRAKRRWTAVETQHPLYGRDLRWRLIPGTMTRLKALKFGAQRIENELSAYRAARDAARARYGMDALDAAVMASIGRWKGVSDTIAKTPAESIFGIGVKLTVAIHLQGNYDNTGAAFETLKSVASISGVDFMQHLRQQAVNT
jgi:hypothetical protein